jgi:hypothetical protein
VLELHSFLDVRILFIAKDNLDLHKDAHDFMSVSRARFCQFNDLKWELKRWPLNIGVTYLFSITLFAGWWLASVLMLMLIYYERKILLNGWLILADKFERIG